MKISLLKPFLFQYFQVISIKNEAFEEDQMEEIPKTPKDEKVLDNSVDKKARYVIPIIYLSYVGVFVVAIVLNQS